MCQGKDKVSLVFGINCVTSLYLAKQDKEKHQPARYKECYDCVVQSRSSDPVDVFILLINYIFANFCRTILLHMTVK